MKAFRRWRRRHARRILLRMVGDDAKIKDALRESQETLAGPQYELIQRELVRRI